MSAQTNWDDLRFILAVAEAGSVAGAARALGVNHATVLRRIATFETRHGLRIFDKTAQGYRISPDRRALIEDMREAGAALAAIDRRIGQERPSIGTSIRITSTDSLCAGPLPDIAADLASEGGMEVDLISTNAHSDLNRLHADIAVRPSQKLPDDLRGETPLSMELGVYATAAASETWIGLSGALTKLAGWPALSEAMDRPALSADSFITLAGLVEAGRGRAVLPHFIARARKGLIRLPIDPGLKPVPIWVASHEDVWHSARLKRARAFIIDRLAALAPEFAP